jgi:hypothetical protein
MSDIQRKRNRNTVSLSDHGKQSVRQQLAKKQWTYETWAGLSYVSLSTAKRLVSGTNVTPDSLTELLRSLGLELNEAYLVRSISMLTPARFVAQALPSGVLSTNYQPGVFIVGQYNERNKAKIDRAVSHLRELMVGSEFSFEEIDGTIVVNGSFPAEKEASMRAVVKHLESLLTAPTVSWHGSETVSEEVKTA